MKTGLNHIVIGVGNYYIFAHLKLYLFINYNKNILNHNKNILNYNKNILKRYKCYNL